MKNISFKKAIPYLSAIIIFYIITAIYFNPLLQGKRLNQADIMNTKGATKEINDYRAKTGEEPLWTNSMFGGMPTYQISTKYQPTILTYLDKILKGGFPHPVGIVLVYFLGFFLLLIVLKVNPWLSIVGSIAFAFSSYFFILFDAGHNTKALAIAYMAPVLAGIILAYRGKWLLSAVITTVFLGLEIKANHYQITYYLLIIVIIYGIFELYNAFKSKTISDFLKSTGVLVIAVIFSIFLNMPGLWTTVEYSKDTMRGKSELVLPGEKTSSGLDIEYATRWSYGIQETFSLLIPNVKGGSTGYIGNNEKAMTEVNPQLKQAIASQNHYWGNQPGTSGPVYVGAIVMFLFIYALFIVRGKYKWIVLIATILSIVLSWGRNFMPVTEFFMDYIPLYNKFRAVTMTLVIAEFCIPLLAFLGINEILKNPDILKTEKNKLYISLGLTGGISALFYLFPSLFFSFFSDMESMRFDQLKQSNDPAQITLFMNSLESVRIAIFKADAIRSLFYILAAAVLLWLYRSKMIKANLFVLILGLLISADMITICKRYLNNDNYIRKSLAENPFPATIVDKQILKDTDTYRVYNISVNSFNETSTSYYHQSIGGYSAAKFHRYQDLIDYRIIPETDILKKTLSEKQTIENFRSIFSSLTTLSMLNTRYIIVDPKNTALQNPFACGNAWFVEGYKLVDSANEEMSSLDDFNPKTTAIINKDFYPIIEKSNPGNDPAASIKLDSYQPNYLIYKSNSQVDQIAVFSEIYYDKGWKAFIDGNEVPHFRANYILRAMIVPQGEHTIEFKFAPKSYSIGNVISLFASIFVLLIIVYITYLEFRKAKSQID